jgi:hypothetical protein
LPAILAGKAYNFREKPRMHVMYKHVIVSFRIVISTEYKGIELVMGDTIEKVSKSSILTKVSILSILAKSIGNSIPLEPAMFLSVFLINRLILHEGNRLKAKNVDMLFLNKNM